MQVHERLPSALQTPPGFKRWAWSPLLKVMLPALGLPVGADEPAAAEQLFEKVSTAAGEGSGDKGEAGADFKPDARGYRVRLCDGVCTRLRLPKARWPVAGRIPGVQQRPGHPRRRTPS